MRRPRRCLSKKVKDEYTTEDNQRVQGDTKRVDTRFHQEKTPVVVLAPLPESALAPPPLCSAFLIALFLHSSRARAKLPGGLSTLSPRSAPTHQDSTFFHEPSRAPFLASEGSFDAASTHLPSATHPATENLTYRALYLFKCETLPNVLLWKTCFYGASLCYKA